MSAVTQQLLLSYGSAAATPMSNTFVAATSSAPSLATHTYAGVNFGTADATRRIIVQVAWNAIATLSSATIGGVAATTHVNGLGPNLEKISFISALVPTGTSGTIAITFSA